MANPLFFEQLDTASSFVGARAQRLTNLVSDQGDEFLKVAGLTIASRCISTILYLDKSGPASLVEIARALGEQHQLTSHRLAELAKLSLIIRKSDPTDKRRRTFHLTREGKLEAQKTDERCADAMQVFEALNREIGFDVGKVLNLAFEALERQSITERAALRKQE